jgi:hypothetical protein
MAWLEQMKDAPQAVRPPPAREQELEKARDESLPVVNRQVGKGQLPVQPVRLQPVRSPGIYEGEFGVKDGDVLFHFWPYGYHEAERQRLAAPHFPARFEGSLLEVMNQEFGKNRVEILKDDDVGAYCVIARNWASQQMHFELSVRACEKLHKALGGA